MSLILVSMCWGMGLVFLFILPLGMKFFVCVDECNCDDVSFLLYIFGGGVVSKFFAYILPCFENCVTIWSSAAGTNLNQLKRALGKVKIFVPNVSLTING